MLRTPLLLALVSPVEASCPPQPERVFLGAVVTDDARFHNRVVEVCGIVQEIGDRDPRERVLYDGSRHSHFWMYVYDAERSLPPEGSRACVVGAFRRRDGYSPAEARARGLPRTTLTDGLQRPDYVFYPVQCSYDGPALG